MCVCVCVCEGSIHVCTYIIIIEKTRKLVCLYTCVYVHTCIIHGVHKVQLYFTFLDACTRCAEREREKVCVCVCVC